MQRRTFLRTASVSVALPWLPSLAPSTAVAGIPRAATKADSRMVCIGNMLGFYPAAFWPEVRKLKDGSGLVIHNEFELGQTTKPLDAIRDRTTIIGGLDHGTKGGHFAIHSFLSGVKQIDAGSMEDGNVTIDQFAAESIPGLTRFPSLTIGSEDGIHGGCQISWTRTGTRVPPIPGPEQLFKKLFVNADSNTRATATDRFELQGSILDLVRDQARSVERELNTQDKRKLDEYFTSVREVEQRLEMRRNWIDVPKPEAPIPAPKNRNMVEDLPLLYELIALALQTNSTRVATLEIGGDFNPTDLGVRGGYHALSHHGQRTESIEALITLETYQVEQFVKFIERLSEIEDGESRLIDKTSVLFGSGMGNANSHTNTNLPVVLCGGGFEHGRLLSFDESDSHRPPLTNLFVTMLQQFGVETDRFATSTGTLRGFA